MPKTTVVDGLWDVLWDVQSIAYKLSLLGVDSDVTALASAKVNWEDTPLGGAIVTITSPHYIPFPQIQTALDLIYSYLALPGVPAGCLPLEFWGTDFGQAVQAAQFKVNGDELLRPVDAGQRLIDAGIFEGRGRKYAGGRVGLAVRQSSLTKYVLVEHRGSRRIVKTAVSWAETLAHFGSED